MVDPPSDVVAVFTITRSWSRPGDDRVVTKATGVHGGLLRRHLRTGAAGTQDEDPAPSAACLLPLAAATGIDWVDDAVAQGYYSSAAPGRNAGTNYTFNVSLPVSPGALWLRGLRWRCRRCASSLAKACPCPGGTGTCSEKTAVSPPTM